LDDAGGGGVSDEEDVGGFLESSSIVKDFEWRKRIMYTNSNRWIEWMNEWMNVASDMVEISHWVCF
jgi:hypothetical protein